jgi:hypothetical protein
MSGFAVQEPLFDIDETINENAERYIIKKSRIEELIKNGTTVPIDLNNIMIASHNTILSSGKNLTLVTKLWIYAIAELGKHSDLLAQGLLDIVLLAGTWSIGKKTAKVSILLIKKITEFLVRTDIKVLLITAGGITKYGFLVSSLVTSLLFWSGYSVSDIRNYIDLYLKGAVDENTLNVILLNETPSAIDNVSVPQSLAHLNTCLMYLKNVYVRNINLTNFANSIVENAENIFAITKSTMESTVESTVILFNDLKTSSKVLLSINDDDDYDDISISSKGSKGSKGSKRSQSKSYSSDDSQVSEATIESTATDLTSQITAGANKESLLDNLIEVNDNVNLEDDSKKLKNEGMPSQNSLITNDSQTNDSHPEYMIGGSKKSKTSKKSSKRTKHTKKTSKRSKKNTKRAKKSNKKSKKH